MHWEMFLPLALCKTYSVFMGTISSMFSWDGHSRVKKTDTESLIGYTFLYKLSHLIFQLWGSSSNLQLKQPRLQDKCGQVSSKTRPGYSSRELSET